MRARQASRPCMIPMVQVAPGSMSRGAIQHWIPADSKWAQIVSAVSRSLLEWLMKTIDGNASCAVSGTLVHLFVDSLHKIPRGRGSSKGADDGHFADHRCPNLVRSLR